MNFDCIIANAPYEKIGCDITKKVIEQNPDSNYAMLGTRRMFKPFYADTLACAFVQIGKYELGSNVKLDWGVEQAILLATNGWTEVIDNRKKEGGNKVGANLIWLDHTGCMGRTRNAHLVGVGSISIHNGAFADYRTSHLVQLPCADTIGTAATHARSTTLTQVNKSVDVKFRNGYIYVSFETFEEACECAIDIVSWVNPTDSHYRCVKWGFVTGLRSHERYKEEGEQ